MALGIIGDIIKGILAPATALIDTLHTSDEEKLTLKAKMLETQAALAIEMERATQAEWDAKKGVLVAELQQGDTYTKRARPTVVYAGLGILVANHIILPWIAFYAGLQIPKIEIPPEFWWGWSGIVTTWVIGRSTERRGVQNRFIKAVTGNGGA